MATRKHLRSQPAILKLWRSGLGYLHLKVFIGFLIWKKSKKVNGISECFQHVTNNCQAKKVVCFVTLI